MKNLVSSLALVLGIILIAEVLAVPFSERGVAEWYMAFVGILAVTSAWVYRQ